MAQRDGDDATGGESGNAAGGAPPPPPPPPPLRQEQVENAVTFLRHPKVRDSPVASKRSFLERKGLSTAEIDAAFQAVGNDADMAPASTSFPQSSTQPPGPAPSTTTHSWSKAFLGVSIIAAGAYALQKFAFPWVWDRVKGTERSGKEDIHENPNPNATALETQRQLKQYCGSIERTMQEMTMEIRTLCSKIDMLAMEARRDPQRRDIEEIKLLLNGLADTPYPGSDSPSIRNTLLAPGDSPASCRPLPLSSAGNGQGVNPEGSQFKSKVEGSVAGDAGGGMDDNQAGYMNVLGLLANGQSLPDEGVSGEDDAKSRSSTGASASKAPARGWGSSVGNGGSVHNRGQSSQEEIQPDNPAQDRIGGSSPFPGSGTNSWTPPPLPEATINLPPSGNGESK